MATGKKTVEPEEEKPAAPKAVEQPHPTEASVAVEESQAAEAVPEAAVEAAPEVQGEVAAESPVESMAAAPSQEEIVDERPFHEPAPEAPAEVHEESTPVEAAPVETAAESAWSPEPVMEESVPVEAAPAETAAEAEAVASPESVVEESAPVEAAPVETVAEAEAAASAESVVEESAPVAEAVSDRALEEPADVRPFHEGTTEALAEEAKTTKDSVEAAAGTEEAKTADDSAVKEDAGYEESGSAGEMRWGQEAPVGGWMGPQRRSRKLPLPGSEGDSLTTEEYRRLKAERRRMGADVVPSPEETSYLKVGRTSEELTEQELRRMSQDPMWKTLVQFKGWLPVVTSLLPVLDMASGRSGSDTSDEMKDTMDGLLVSHRDVRATLQNQTAELKRVEEEVAKLRDATDKTAFEQTAMSDDVKSMQRLVKNASLYLGILLGLLVAVVGYMAFLVFSYLNHPAH